MSTTSRQNLQLVGVSALFIASKYEELYPPEVKDFAFITDDTYTKHQIIEMEKHILKVSLFAISFVMMKSIHFIETTLIFVIFLEIAIRIRLPARNSFLKAFLKGGFMRRSNSRNGQIFN